MRLYQINKGKLSEIKETSFKLEKDLQRLVEENLEMLMGLQVIKSEFPIEDCRFDTLAYNPEDKSFVIIEYKRGANNNLTDQGMTYLNLLLGHKEAAVLEMNNLFRKNLSIKDIYWENTKVVFIIPSSTKFQKGSLNSGLPIDLLEIKRYGTNLISVTPVPKKGDPVSMNAIIRKSSVYDKVAKEIKNYTEGDHLAQASEEIKELYAEFKSAILNLDSQIEIEAKKLYVAFKKEGANICDIEIHSKNLKIYANAKWGDLEDSKGLFNNVSNVGHWGNGDYRVVVNSNKDLEYIMSVIKQLL